jgi:hypothetical protein
MIVYAALPRPSEAHILVDSQHDFIVSSNNELDLM